MSEAERVMFDFAARTGLASGAIAPKRYLWTDAFAVCNFLGIFAATGQQEARRLALALVDQVHHALGRHRADDPRRGWISGLDEQRGERHPTIGGLRIGKELPERRSDEPFDDALEWERDGQYFHYLTKWMHALDCVGRAERDATYHRWAVELARTAHARFTYRAADGRQRMYWKMSIDLSRPQVASMGQHDPLDAFITYRQLQAGAAAPALRLDAEIAESARMCAGQSWLTSDPLGIGGLLTDACRLAQLAIVTATAELELLENLLWSAARGLELIAADRSFRQSADYRLAFRELGMAIGLHAVAVIGRLFAAHPQIFGDRLAAALRAVAKYEALGEETQTFWLQPSSRVSRTWAAHRDINEVMLATCLAPETYLTIADI